jgi:N6-L-threonylcarbamoyladenine synthase
MFTLGIESSCDETAAAVVDENGRLASDVVKSQVALHAPFGGVVPELASRDHMRVVAAVVREALARAKTEGVVPQAVAATARPGLSGALLVGLQFAKGFAWASGLPFVAVDHLVGHLLAVYVRRPNAPPPPCFPFVALLASGGHTALYRVDGPTAPKIRELGATRDDAAGEAFDKVAKLLGLGYPGGPIVDKLAAKGDASRFTPPMPMARSDSLEFSFSGIKTYVARFVAEHGRPSDDAGIADMCAGFQRAVVTSLVKKTIRAARREKVDTIVLSGGVAANRELRTAAEQACAQAGLSLAVPPLASCTDNAAMIAYAGAVALSCGARDGWETGVATRTLLPRVTRKGGGQRGALHERRGT